MQEDIKVIKGYTANILELLNSLYKEIGEFGAMGAYEYRGLIEIKNSAVFGQMSQDLELIINRMGTLEKTAEELHEKINAVEPEQNQE